jgi:hypothetical protein
MSDLPKKQEIRSWWSRWLVQRGKFDSVKEATEADYCFACGFKANTERAHITAEVEGGTDAVENLPLLCATCHRQSEKRNGYEYYQWVRRQNLISMLAHGAHLTDAIEESTEETVEVEAEHLRIE